MSKTADAFGMRDFIEGELDNIPDEAPVPNVIRCGDIRDLIRQLSDRPVVHTPESNLLNAIQDILESRDDAGCAGDVTVVSLSALERLDDCGITGCFHETAEEARNCPAANEGTIRRFIYRTGAFRLVTGGTYEMWCRNGFVFPHYDNGVDGPTLDSCTLSECEQCVKDGDWVELPELDQ